MASQVDPKKLKSMLNQSQTELNEEPADEEEEGESADGEESEDEGDEEGDEEGEEQTVESLTKALKPAVATINEIVDEFRTGSDAQPKAGVEQLEEMEDLGAETVHGFCEWTEEAGKKDFRALGTALELEDVDGFVGWCRAVRKMEEEGGDEEDGEGKADTGDETDEEEPEGEGEDEGAGE
jgi:hypothetical protein